MPLCLGIPSAVIVFLVVALAAGPENLSTIWRLCFALGIPPLLVVLYLVHRMEQPRLYRSSAIKHQIPYRLTLSYYWRSLVGTCMVWFLYDFVLYPNHIFSAMLIGDVVGKDASIIGIGCLQLLLASFALPGAFLGGLAVEQMGRRTVMILGFSGFVVLSFFLVFYNKQLGLNPAAFVSVYGLLKAVAAFGPGNMIMLVSSESYATSVRGKCLGLSAAIGKLGAVVGTSVFLSIKERWDVAGVFTTVGFAGLLGVIVTLVFVKSLHGENLEMEDRRFHEYLRSNGWSGDIGEDRAPNPVDG
jgi:MFS family permease